MENSIVNEDLKEIISHGSAIFPYSLHHTNQEGENEITLYKHWHDEAEILYVREGEMEVMTGSKSLIANTETLIFIPPNSLHGAYRTNNMPCHFSSIVFHPNFVNSYTNDQIQQDYLNPLFENKHSYIFSIESQNNKKKILPLIRQMENSFIEKENGRELLLKSLLLQLLYYFMTYPPKSQLVPERGDRNIERQKKILEYISNNYTSPVTLEELSSVLHLSKEQFCRFFKNNFRDTPISYLRKYRINKAIELLLKSDMKITDIAYEVGFESSNYFTIAFKDVLKLSPKEFKRQHKKEGKFTTSPDVKLLKI
ncbi:AraC family transcriptional regulator [Niallia sp.]|uniref:AraC family transcriptional regulator n=1 Tax=Niallia sp. TaxID=2837523 RepID=UPI00289E959A|nr:AraC family transcriptional regulator [Niallia sp.]